MERLRGERADLRKRIKDGLWENAEEVRREKAELEDRVEDLEAVKGAVEDEVEEGTLLFLPSFLFSA
jgi:hypothetical protein